MRVEGGYASQIVGYRGVAANVAAGEPFVPHYAAEAPVAAASGGVAAMAGIEALLALQAAEDPVRSKRKALKRARAMLDVLNELRADLLTGRIAEGRLNQLLALLGQARDGTTPELDAAIDDIELRVRVELAKRGR